VTLLERSRAQAKHIDKLLATLEETKKELLKQQNDCYDTIQMIEDDYRSESFTKDDYKDDDDLNTPDYDEDDERIPIKDTV
jgi:hypothetical protein